MASPFADQKSLRRGILNLPAGLILLFILSILMLGTRNSASFNNLMVFVKLGIIALFLILGSRHINPANWHPFFFTEPPESLRGR